MTVGRGQITAVDSLQLLDDLARLGRERRLALEGMQDDTFEEVAEAHFGVLGEALEHFEQR